MNYLSASLRMRFLCLLVFSILVGLANFAVGQPPLLPPAAPDIVLGQSGNAGDPFSYAESQSLSFGGISISLPSTPSSIGTISLTGTVLGGANPSVSATIKANFNLIPSGEPIMASISNLSYSLEIVGPAAVSVPVDVVGTLADSWSTNLAGGGFVDKADVAVFDPNGTLVNLWRDDVDSYASGSQVVSIDQTIDLTSDTIYSVLLGATTDLEAYALDPAIILPPSDYSISALVDPMFTIAPTFALTTPGYSIEYSPNLVPDSPNTLCLLGLSLFGFVVVRFRRLRAGCDG